VKRLTSPKSKILTVTPKIIFSWKGILFFFLFISSVNLKSHYI